VASTLCFVAEQLQQQQQQQPPPQERQMNPLYRNGGAWAVSTATAMSDSNKVSEASESTGCM
jgi:hypothetical protein